MSSRISHAKISFFMFIQVLILFVLLLNGFEIPDLVLSFLVLSIPATLMWKKLEEKSFCLPRACRHLKDAFSFMVMGEVRRREDHSENDNEDRYMKYMSIPERMKRIILSLGAGFVIISFFKMPMNNKAILISLFVILLNISYLKQLKVLFVVQVFWSLIKGKSLVLIFFSFLLCAVGFFLIEAYYEFFGRYSLYSDEQNWTKFIKDRFNKVFKHQTLFLAPFVILSFILGHHQLNDDLNLFKKLIPKTEKHTLRKKKISRVSNLDKHITNRIPKLSKQITENEQILNGLIDRLNDMELSEDNVKEYEKVLNDINSVSQDLDGMKNEIAGLENSIINDSELRANHSHELESISNLMAKIEKNANAIDRSLNRQQELLGEAEVAARDMSSGKLDIDQEELFTKYKEIVSKKGESFKDSGGRESGDSKEDNASFNRDIKLSDKDKMIKEDTKKEGKQQTIKKIVISVAIILGIAILFHFLKKLFAKGEILHHQSDDYNEKKSAKTLLKLLRGKKYKDYNSAVIDTYRRYHSLIEESRYSPHMAPPPNILQKEQFLENKVLEAPSKELCDIFCKAYYQKSKISKNEWRKYQTSLKKILRVFSY